MTPAQKIKHAILLETIEACKEYEDFLVPDLTDIDEAYENCKWLDVDEFREGEVETEVDCDWSRHYESKSVAMLIDGTWIGWTYWYGGGKHGEPGAIDWIEGAYELEVTEEEKLVTIRTWKKKC